MEAPDKIYIHEASVPNLEKEFDSFLNDIEGVPPMWHSEEQIEWGKRYSPPFLRTWTCTAK